MTSQPRPNLGGLFTGSAAPEDSTGVAAALARPPAKPVVGQDASVTAGETASSGSGPAAGARRPAGSPRIETGQVRSSGAESSKPPSDQAAQDRWAALEWVDPVRAMERYFNFLQLVLDANRYVAIGCAKAVKSLPERAGLWR